MRLALVRCRLQVNVTDVNLWACLPTFLNQTPFLCSVGYICISGKTQFMARARNITYALWFTYFDLIIPVQIRSCNYHMCQMGDALLVTYSLLIAEYSQRTQTIIATINSGALKFYNY